ncbi:hypothetical protein [Sphaerisporangium sp. TRM90804]|uniref:hypothetical protein n=1 Tax=Sphaerisporangium sp. TRM90804 TaxID=3031113 RepID=UPI00244715C4|nr:hypothetical protein [Sphaerisporangium sp. TRM90804]MDH2427295.1 hypothetical protein [Sphaerisporangium sp. TRM90804]
MTAVIAPDAGGSARRPKGFVRLCHAIGVPPPVAVDVPGFPPGVRSGHRTINRCAGPSGRSRV